MKQIVISVPDEWLEGTQPNLYDVMGAVMNGTALPEHYGRLIDANILESKLNEVFKAMKEVPTIIPATKEGESE